ncbi:uncharacterized protein LOC117781177 [Drosophila innubila]|uniref:uncharacterized protein LOC117781177 n=1 Tax=Drosophila innubila TaxID=198719 RepID=UPI00148C1D09|nr:uncharacterized protein LOC117781177 [Drosophila innubila]
MIILRKFCCCVPLRQGCLILGYYYIILGFLNVYFMMIYLDFCARLKKLWFLHDEVSIIAGVLLLASSHNPENLTFLLPIHMFVKLAALIIELIFYLLLASSNDLNTITAIYSFISIFATVYCLLVVFSFFQILDQQS